MLNIWMLSYYICLSSTRNLFAIGVIHVNITKSTFYVFNLMGVESNLMQDQIIPGEIPDWHEGQTGIPLTDFGTRPNITIHRQDACIGVPEDYKYLLQTLEKSGSTTFFDGPYATVTDFKKLITTYKLQLQILNLLIISF